MLRRFWIATMLGLIGVLASPPRSAEAESMCLSNGSKCKGTKPEACCSGACDLEDPKDEYGKCVEVS